jgi:hypothetical protein
MTVGKKTMADYQRDLVINEKATRIAINNLPLISQIDKIGQEIAKSSANIQVLTLTMENQTCETVEPQTLRRLL